MIAHLPSPLTECLALVAGWLAIGLAGLAHPRSVRYAGRVLFLLGALVGLTLAATAAGRLVSGATEQLVLPVGLPDLPFHVRLDLLSSVFLALLGAAAAGVSLFSAGYFREGEGMAPGLLCLQYHLFLASMALVLLADDAYAFMVGWELMALSSYLLVTALPPARSLLAELAGARARDPRQHRRGLPAHQQVFQSRLLRGGPVSAALGPPREARPC